MIAQFKQGLNNKNFSHQDQDKRDDGLQKRIKFSIMLLIREDQYMKMFMIMIITSLKKISSFVGQSMIQSLEN